MVYQVAARHVFRIEQSVEPPTVFLRKLSLVAT